MKYLPAGILEFGTEVVASHDGSLAALLGASPGASCAVSIMLEILEKCFPTEMASASWQAKIKEMIPTHGKALLADPELTRKTRERTHALLKLALPKQLIEGKLT
jgi:malate dehydrogenase (quinone)